MKRVILMVALAACSAKEAPEMAGICEDRAAPNLFSDRHEAVPFKQCRWQGKVWVCMLEPGADAWKCRAVAADDSL